MWNLRQAIYICAVLLAGLVSARGAFACSCDRTPTVAEARTRAERVFVGRVIRVDEPPPRQMNGVKSSRVISSGDMLRYTLLPILVWKGAPADTLMVYSARNSPSCGFEMATGEVYLLFPRLVTPWIAPGCEWAKGLPTGDVLIVNICTRNKRFSESAEDVLMLGLPVWSGAHE
jgi:hypothetical protein